MIELQRNIYCYIIEYMYKYTSKIPEAVRKLFAQCIFFITLLMYFLNNGIIRLTFRTRNTFYIMCLLLILLCLNNGKCRKMKNNEYFIFPIYILGLGCVIAGFVNEVLGYIFYAVIFLFIFPFAALILGAVNKEYLFNIISKTSVLFFGVITIISILFAPLSSGQYMSLFNDPNSLGLLSVYTLVCTFYLLKREKRSVYLGTAFLCLTFCFLTKSRTSELACIIILIVTCVFFPKKKISLKRLFLIAFSGIMVFSIIIFLLSHITPLISSINMNLYIKEISDRNMELTEGIAISDEKEKISELKPDAADAIETETDNEQNEDVDDIEEHDDKKGEKQERKPSISDIVKSGIKGSLRGLNDDSSFSSGRVNIWKATIQQLNFWGHSTELIDHTNYFSQPMYAHNGFLQCWYSVGIISVLGYSLLWIINIINAIKVFVYSKNNTAEEYLYICIIVVFSLFSILYSMYAPFSDPLSFGYYLLSLCIAKKLGKEEMDFKKIN